MARVTVEDCLERDENRFALVVHDFGGPIALPLALDGRVTRLVILNSWMWSFEDDLDMARRARLVNGRLGRWLYRNANASLRLIMPSAYGDRKCLTSRIHRHYLEPFDLPDHRVLVLHTLARLTAPDSPWSAGDDIAIASSLKVRPGILRSSIPQQARKPRHFYGSRPALWNPAGLQPNGCSNAILCAALSSPRSIGVLACGVTASSAEQASRPSARSPRSHADCTPYGR